MENVIRQLVEKDRRAREITARARRNKLKAEKEIAESAARLKEEYLEQARRRIERNGEMERTIFEQNWKRRRKAYDRQTEAWVGEDAAKHEQWVSAIVAEVLK